MRSALLILLLCISVAGCRTKPDPAATNPPSVRVLFLHEDGTSTTEVVDPGDPNAADAVLRPILASAFARSGTSPRVVRWLIDDSRPSRAAAVVRDHEIEGELRSTASIYRDYRLALASTDIPSMPAIQSRRSPDDPWEDEAGVPDPETGLNRAMEYLLEDLRAVRQVASAAASPAR